ncbi:O-antigen ligase family protein [Zhihengliuella flava]|uniref:O-antigen ligase n=1 Tax=Zhihengliuella flava TaxID=1285193 RepID=A0A931DD91_9MICC|nr:O-antigen ligase family protein [Zhihengliuella flava]MBG6085441.1 O-antigen ligase [Zhihengliuella flava]
MVNAQLAVGDTPRRSLLAPGWWSLRWSERLVFLCLVFLPLQKALTIEAGFPLKISEILLFFALISLWSGHSKSGWQSSPRLKTMTLVLGLLVSVVCASVMWNLLVPLPNDDFPGFDRSLTLDILLYGFYSVMVAIFWLVVSRQSSRVVGVGVSWATRLAALFCAVQIILYNFSDFDTMRLLNMELVVGGAYGEPFPRNGSFHEGNYLGAFAAAVLLILLRRRDWWGALLGLGMLIYSQSTGAIVAVMVGILIAFMMRPRALWQLVATGITLIGLALAYVVDPVREYLAFQVSKLTTLGEDSVAVGEAGRSIVIREGKWETALKIASDSPVLGVGPGRYGVWFHEKYDASLFPSDYQFSNGRAIAENAYGQVVAELGFIGLLIFLAFLILHLLAGSRLGFWEVAVAGTTIVTLWTAPSWTTLTYWMALGVLAAYYGAAKRRAAPLRDPSSVAVTS